MGEAKGTTAENKRAPAASQGSFLAAAWVAALATVCYGRRTVARQLARYTEIPYYGTVSANEPTRLQRLRDRTA